jgi:pyridoxine 5-phosphate synthase
MIDLTKRVGLMTKLSVNVNKVATLRNTRPSLDIPSVVRCAKLCLDAGAHGITVHPRPDQRHIKPRDVDDLARLLEGYPGVELNIEGNPFMEYMPIVERVRPAQATLVPDAVDAKTSDHGWDLARERARLAPIVERLHALGARVSLFMDPVPDAMPLARALGADRVELYTEPYAAAFAAGDAEAAAPYAAAAARARAEGLEVNAGHDLNLANLAPFLACLARVAGVAEVSIGHALIGDALEYGLEATVKKYLRACSG